MLPLVASLLQGGFTLLGNAVLSKGKDVIEDKLGVSIEKLLGTPKGQIALKRLEYENEESLRQFTLEKREQDIREEAVAQDNVTKRWQADSASDSSLAKNIRPGVLAYLTIAITLMAVAPISVDEAWIELLKISYVTVLSAYFLGRSWEKGKKSNEPS